MNTIADHVSACLQEFNSLCNSPTIWENDILDGVAQADVSLLKLQNELSRFKVWSGNIGAHQKGRSSLDHRLRDASNIRDQVAEILKDMRESLKDAKDILTGQLTPWDQELSPAEYSDDDSDDESLKADTSGTSELSQIFSAIVEDINCLFRLSVSIHNPSPHDRFKKACLTDTSGYEPFDVQHVCNKLSKAPKPIAERLGKAISRRRQYFKYRELHHDKLASGLDLDDQDQMQSTVASSLPKKLNVNEPISLEEDGDDVSDAGRSQTSWATSAANLERRKIPALPTEAENGPFECPFCFMMVSVSSRNHWKKHVFSDLFPYICLELGCPAPDQDFQRRHQWAGHVKKYHWKTWTCKLGCNETFVSLKAMKHHLAQKHLKTTELTHLASLLTMCERPKSENEPADCPLCGERQSSFKQYQRHVGRHQEDLALFALPHLPDGLEEKNDELDSESESRDELKKASSCVTRLSDESGDEATAVSERSIGRPPVIVMAGTSDGSDHISKARRKNPPPEEIVPKKCREPGCNKELMRPCDLTKHEKTHSRPWKCPVLTCKYHQYGLVTEDDRDRHYREKHSKTPEWYECAFKPCPFKSKREMNCKHHMEKVHGWTYVRSRKHDVKLPSISNPGMDMAIEQQRKPLVTESADESIEQGREDPIIIHRRIQMMAPIENEQSFDPANVDVLHLRNKESFYTFKFSRHDIRDGKLRVSNIRELAAGMTHVPESFRHLVELSCKDVKLLIDGTPIRNYGVSRGDTIKVEAPQFRNSNPFSGPAGDDPVLDNGRGTEENMDTPYASGPIQPFIETDRKVVISSTPGVRCPTCALEGKEIWVLPGRCCGYCGTPCAEEDTLSLDVDDSFPKTNLHEDWPFFPIPGASDEELPNSTLEGLEKKQVSCPSFSVNGYCMDGAECPLIHDPAMISSSDPSRKPTATVETFTDPDLTMNSNELKVWKALCALENELEVGWILICNNAIISDDGSAQKGEGRLGLIDGIHSDVIKKLRRIEQLSKPDIMAKRRQIEAMVDDLLKRVGVASMTGTDSYQII